MADKTHPPPVRPGQKPEPEEARKRRLAEALRVNLGRRKAQKREREDKPAPPGGDKGG